MPRPIASALFGHRTAASRATTSMIALFGAGESGSL